MKLSAVILAGGTSNEIYVRFGTRYWALVPINGKPMIDYVIKAFKEVGIEDIIIVGKWTTGRTPYLGCKVLPGGKRHIDNVEAGLRAAQEERVIVSTCDIPALTTDALKRLITSYQKYTAPVICFPITLVSDCEREFPGMKRTSLPLRGDGVVTAGNIFIVPKNELLERINVIRPLLEHKKDKVRLALRFGLDVLLILLVSKLTKFPLLRLEKLEARAKKVLGLPVSAEWADPCIASDVDSLDQLGVMEGLLRG